MTTVVTRTTTGGMITAGMAGGMLDRMVTGKEFITHHMATGKESITHRQSSMHHLRRQASASFCRPFISISKERDKRRPIVAAESLGKISPGD